MTHQAPWPPPQPVPPHPSWYPPTSAGPPVSGFGPGPSGWPPPAPGQPPASGWPPPPPQQPGRPIGGLLFLVTVLGIVLALGVNSLIVPMVRSRVLPPVPSASSPAPGPAASESPTPRPSSPAPSPGADAPTLDGAPTTGFTKFGPSDNRLYNLMWRRGEGSAQCDQLTVTAPSVSAAKLTTYGKSVIDCLLALHRPQAKAQGFTIDTPKFVTFAGTERTACGVIADEQVGVYCGRNKTIYISTVADDWKNTYRGARLGYLWVISHEFAHHLQASTGLLRDSDTKDLKESRRIELMANCASGVFFGAVWTQLGGGPVEYKQLRSALQSTYANEVPGRGTHGSPASAVLWFDRGFKHEYAAYARCNTFRAPSNEVR